MTGGRRAASGGKAHRRGRPFFAMLAAFILFVALLAAVNIVLCHAIAADMGEQARAGMRAALRSNMALLSEARGVTQLADLGEQLDDDGLLARMASSQGGPDEASAAELEGRLKALEEQNEEWGETSWLAVYFPASGAIVDTYAPGDCIDAGVLDGFVAEMREDGQEELTRFLFDELGAPTSMRICAHGEGAYAYIVLVTKGQPGTADAFEPLVEEYGYQTYFYDSYGAAVPVRGSDDSLLGLYDYYTLGDADSGSFSFQYQGVAYDCCYEKVADSDTKFALFAVDTAAQMMQGASRVILAAALALVAVGALLAYVLARRLYRPVQDLVDQLPEAGGGGLRDDYRLIGDALTDHRQKTRASVLLHRLHGLGSDFLDAYGRDADRFFFDDAARPYAVAAVRVDALQEGHDVGAAPDGSLTAAGALQEVYGGSAGHEGHGWPEDPDRHAGPEGAVLTEPGLEGQLAAYCGRAGFEAEAAWDGETLLRVFDLSGHDMVGLGVLLENVRVAAEKQHGLLLSLFCSSAHVGPGQLHQAYSEAMQAAEYCALLERYNTVQGYDAIRAQMRGGQAESLVDRKLLRELGEDVESLQADEALAAFDSVASGLVAAGEGMLPQVKAAMGLLRSTLADAVLRVDMAAVPDRDVLAGHAEALLDAQALPDLRGALASALDDMSARNARQSSDNGRFQQMRDFVDGAYADPNLSAGMVAERFGTCQSNVTRMFKKYNGTGFLEYLQLVRVGKAKELLRTTPLSVAEVASRVGYTNPLTLTRAFKRYVGKTPGAYKRDGGEG